MSEADNLRAMNAALNATYAAIDSGRVDQALTAADWTAIKAAFHSTGDLDRDLEAVFRLGMAKQRDALATQGEIAEALVRARSYIAAKVSPAEPARGPLLGIIDAAIAKARDADAPVVHIRRPDARWPKDDVPACAGPGDKPTDLYTNDRRRVTCAACLRALEDER